MLKRSIPFALAESIYEIPASFYKGLGVKAVLVDLDNTLDPYTVSHPGEKARKWKEELGEAGLRIVILSNNSGGRVGLYSRELGVEARYLMRKPFAGPLRKFLRQEGYSPNEVILVGDQIQTDVLAGNGAGVRVILTEPLFPKEPPWTKFNRLFDRPKRAKIKSRGLAKSWKEIGA